MIPLEIGDRVAMLRQSPLTQEIQIIHSTVVALLDDDQVLVEYANGERVSWPRSSLTAAPDS